MKKFVSIIMIAAMLMSFSSVFVYGESSGDLEKAILSAKGRVEIPAECTEFTSNVYETDGITEYRLQWSTPSEQETYVFTEAIINSKGDITSYNISRHTDVIQEDDGMSFSEYSAEEIKSMARSWIAGLNPSWINELPEDKTNVNMNLRSNGKNHRVEMERYVNGLPFCYNTVSIRINEESGKVESFYSDWTYGENVPKADEAISAEKAEEAFLKGSPITLEYIYSADKEMAILVYSPKDDYYKINGRTGEVFEEFAYRVSGGGMGAAMNKMDAATAEDGAYKELTESEIANVTQIEGLLSGEVLNSMVMALENTIVKDAVLVSCEYNSQRINDEGDEKQKYTAALRYTAKDGGFIYVNMDAETGELISYSDNSERERGKEAKISYDEAVASADKFVKKYGGSDVEDKLELSDNDNDNEKLIWDYYINYNRTENGCLYYGNNISISVDNQDGIIRSYYKNWNSDLKFESPDGIISSNEAEAALFEKVGLELSYQKAQGESATNPVVELMYKLNYKIPSIISAKTGEILSYDGSVYVPEEEKNIYPTDISGHYAEEQILKLIDAGILTLEEEDFRPDDVITQKDLLAFVSGLKMGYVPFYENEDTVLRTAKRYGIIDGEVKSDEPALREMGPEYIIRTLGYKAVAELKDIYVTSFGDDAEISADKKGYIAIAKGFKIVSGDENGCFKPKDMLTRADAAIMIYNYLNRRGCCVKTAIKAKRNDSNS